MGAFELTILSVALSAILGLLVYLVSLTYHISQRLSRLEFSVFGDGEPSSQSQAERIFPIADTLVLILHKLQDIEEEVSRAHARSSSIRRSQSRTERRSQ